MRYTHIIAPLSLLALATLGACGAKDETVNDTAGDPMEKQLANAAPVELPPAVKANKTYRCKDNSLVYVDFFQGDTSANIRTEKDGKPTKLTAPEAGKPLEGDGFKVDGQGASVTITLPGKSAQSCKA